MSLAFLRLMDFATDHSEDYVTNFCVVVARLLLLFEGRRKVLYCSCKVVLDRLKV